MAESTLAPAFIKVFYSVTFSGEAPHQHVQVVPVQPETTSWSPGDNPDLVGRNSSLTSWTEFCELWGLAMAEFYGTGWEVNRFEFWLKPTTTSDPIFINVYLPVAPFTPAGGTNIRLSQTVVTFRSTGGGIGKFYFMEASPAVNTRDIYPFVSGGGPDAISDLVLASNAPVIARDNTYLIIGIASSSKTSDALRRKYLLDA